MTPTPWMYEGDERGRYEGILLADGSRAGSIWKESGRWHAFVPGQEVDNADYVGKKEAAQAVADAFAGVRPLWGHRVQIRTQMGPGAWMGTRSAVVRVRCDCGYVSNNCAGDSADTVKEHLRGALRDAQD